MADRRNRVSLRILLGLGFDSDGHARVTAGEDYVLLGGSEQTHERMQDDIERFRDTLQQMGTDLQRASRDEVLEAAHECGLIK
ncbi:MAG: hypothetical protein ACYTEZ_17930 [Planctomycetota bacterium]|jgi:hypothetical protein